MLSAFCFDCAWQDLNFELHRSHLRPWQDASRLCRCAFERIIENNSLFSRPNLVVFICSSLLTRSSNAFMVDSPSLFLHSNSSLAHPIRLQTCKSLSTFMVRPLLLKHAGLSSQFQRIPRVERVVPRLFRRRC